MEQLSRRHFLAQSGSCACHLTLVAAGVTAARARLWAQSPAGQVVAQEPFGRLEKITDGVWALVSTPLGGERTTLCNGGIVQGKDGVLAVEGFMQPQGAGWLAARARELTGRPPTHVVLTHYHADHTNGVAGYFTGAHRPVVRVTAATRDQTLRRNVPADAARTDALDGATLVEPATAQSIDLGGRVVRVLPTAGHTDSDVALEIDDPNVVFCGDLVWNGMFPNFVDSSPSRLSDAVRSLRRAKSTWYVPGHGPLAREPEFDRYVSVIGEVEQAARRAHAQGLSAADGAARFALPPSLGEWTLFNKAFFERAFAAWYRDLESRKG